MNSEQFKNHLTQNIIPFWNRLRDEAYGGFYGYVDGCTNVDRKADKGVILHSRILWFYSSAYMLLEDKQLLVMADHAYHFLTKYCMDGQNGGVYWSVHYDGSIADDTKHTYNQAFAIYALAAYYRASGNREALNQAYELYNLIEERCSDEGGYLEAFNREFVLAGNEKLSENGVMASRTMNTLLHVMEAYTELYIADSREAVAEALRIILIRFRQKIYNTVCKRCEVFFDADYQSLIDLTSFGHNIEASWLLDRAFKVLGEEGTRGIVLEEMKLISDGLAESSYHNGMDFGEFALNNESENGKIDTQKVWWVQAEAVIGFYNAYQKHPDQIKYKECAEKTWQFIQKYVVDKTSGEWIESIRDTNRIDHSQALVHEWKCPYHNGRMCMEMMQRLTD